MTSGVLRLRAGTRVEGFRSRTVFRQGSPDLPQSPIDGGDEPSYGRKSPDVGVGGVETVVW